MLGVAGAYCVVTALQMSHRHIGLVLGVLLCGLVLWSVVLWRLLQRRNPPAVTPGGEPVMSNDSPALYRMVSGRTYEVQQDFTDHARQIFRRGEQHVFLRRHFLPYHDGHTLVFHDAVLQLQGDEQREMVEHWEAYMVPVHLPIVMPAWPVVDPALRSRVDALLANPDGPPHADPAHEQAARAASRALHEAVWAMPVNDPVESTDDGIGRLNDTMTREAPWLGPQARGALIHSFVMNRR